MHGAGAGAAGRGGQGVDDAAARAAGLLTGTVGLRPARPADAGAIAAIYAPHVVAGVASFEAEAPDADAIAARMDMSFYPWLVAATEDLVMGYAYAARFRDREAYRWTAETTIYLADAARGCGIGRRLYDALLATLARQGFVRAIGAIALPNAASVRLHEAAGFRAAGVLRSVGYKHGRWIDVGYWERGLAAPVTPPREPRPFSEIGFVTN